MANQTPEVHPQPFPELAQALRARTQQIIQAWFDQVRRAIPAVHGFSDKELQDNLPNILRGLADLLSAANGRGENLVRESPEQGVKRFQQRYDVRDLMHEDRLLRAVIFQQVEAQLGRRTTLDEQIALDLGIDLMLQQSVAAYVDQLSQRIRAGAESELKYLSFLSHDLNNHLAGVTLFLQVLRQRLAEFPEFTGDVLTLDHIQESILNTIGGMGRLLQNERLRRAGGVGKITPVHLHRLASNVAQPLLRQAEHKGLRVAVDIPPDAVVPSDGELITLALQNLIGNAIKYSSKGVVGISGKQDGDGNGNGNRWVLTVSDEGPGIAQEHLGHIFEAFKRGDAHGQQGVGLGLAIAAQAAKLLGAELTVESALGIGSKFRMTLPATPAPIHK